MGPTGQVFEPIGAKQSLEAALEMIGYGQELPEDEAIGVACGWWPSFGSASGATSSSTAMAAAPSSPAPWSREPAQ